VLSLDDYQVFRSFERLSSTFVCHVPRKTHTQLPRGRLRPMKHSPLPNYHSSIHRRPQALHFHTHVSYPVCRRVVLQFSTNNQQCLGRVQETHQEGSSLTSTRRPAPSLSHSRCHSYRTSRANRWVRSIPRQRRTMVQMA
jgi:hypothetical protein